MAFEWDEIQARFLQRRLGPGAGKFETKYQVAGSSLAIDAVVEEPPPEPFFDFLTPLTLIENKAPSETFSGKQLCRCTARALLYVERKRLRLEALGEITQVLLCSRATSEVREFLPWTELRPGIGEASFVTRLVLVEANRLPLEESTLDVLVHYASGRKLRQVIEYVVERQLEKLYTVLWFFHRREFKEVLEMKGESTEGLVIDIRGAIEELGLRRVVEELGVHRVVEELGVRRVIGEVGLRQVIDEVGLKVLIREAGPEQVREALRSIEEGHD